jgi:hypothetical protein
MPLWHRPCTCCTARQSSRGESTYQKALAEIRVGDAGDAITDAGIALQAALTALGWKGGTLGQLVTAARNDGLLRGNDTPLTESQSGELGSGAPQRRRGAQC